MKCKIALDEPQSCGKFICCHHYPDKEVCMDACNFTDVNQCPDFIQEENELQVMQSAVPEAIKAITEISIQKKKLDEQEKLMRQKLLEAMEAYNVKKFETAHVAFTYVAPATKTTLDSAKLKKKYPDIAEECSKVSNASAYVKITVK